MHVIHVVESFATGTREVVRVLANQQVAAGIRVSVWYGVTSATPSDPKVGFDSKVNFIQVPKLGQRSIIALSRSFLWLLSRRDQGGSIVHLHSSFAGALVRAACFKASNSIVYTPHGFSLVRTDMSRFKREIVAFVERVLDRMTSTVIVGCSRSEAAVIQDSLPNASVRVVENGLDFKGLGRFEHTREFHTPLRIVSIGRVCKQKNYDDLIHLVQVSEQSLEVVVVGDGGAVDVKRLRAAGVTVTGWVPSDDVANYLNWADVYIQCGLWEGMPISVMEAMIGGLPVLARDAVGTRDLVKHLETGLVYRTPQELVGIVNSPRLKMCDWPVIRKSAYEQVRFKLTPENMHVGYLRLYSSKYV